MLKSDIINMLGRKHGFTRYLEICTRTTGNRYLEVDRRQYRFCRRLAYRWPAAFDDGAKVDIRIESDEIDRASLAALEAEALYDLVLVDPWHGYETSLRDIRLAMRLLARDGIVVVHDCSPPSLELAAPDFQPGDWCGLTYAALVDFVLAEPGLDVYTVDADFGCAVIRRRRPETGTCVPASPELIAGWRATRDCWQERYRYFDLQRRDLIHLVPVAEFIAREGLWSIRAPMIVAGWRARLGSLGGRLAGAGRFIAKRRRSRTDLCR